MIQCRRNFAKRLDEPFHGAFNPKFAVENPLPGGAQSCRRKDNALLPLSGFAIIGVLRSSLPP
jgi:hypothetical protein